MHKYILVLSLLACFSEWVGAQVPVRRFENKWEISGFFGSSRLADRDFITAVEGLSTTETVGLRGAAGYVVGVRITENLGQHSGAELEYSFANHPLVFAELRPGLARLELDHKVHKVAYSVLFYPFNRGTRLRPFASAGVGTSFFRISDGSKRRGLEVGAGFTDRWKFAFTYGGGAKIQMGENWGFRVDLRDHVTGVPDFGLPSVAPQFQGRIGAGFRPEGTYHSWQFSVGLMYTLMAP